MKIPVSDVRFSKNEENAVTKVIRSNRITEWTKVAEFEKQFARFVGSKHCVAMNSGTSALVAGVEALKHSKEFNIKAGSKAIVPALTYVATSNAAILSGIEPLFVDVNADDFCISVESLKTVLEEREDVSLLMPVHLMGFAADMPGIMKIAGEHNLAVFEDVAEANGSLLNGKRLGSFGHLAEFSFYASHNIQCGELGAIVTNAEGIADLCKKIKSNGKLYPEDDISPYVGEIEDPYSGYTHAVYGYNFKTTEISAALAIEQLKKYKQIHKKRYENVKYLNDELEEFSGLLQLPKLSKDVSYFAYTVLIKEPSRISRKKVREMLEKKGIETRPLFGCVPLHQPAYASYKPLYQGKLPNAEFIGKNAFYVGCHQFLSEKELSYIAKVFREIFKGV